MSKHPIVHVEFSAENRESAGQFYKDLFGWEIQQFPELNYATFSTGEAAPGGGFSPITEGNPPGTVTVYISTEDIQETLRKSVSLGGEVLMQPEPVPDVGLIAIIRDLTGNKVGLLQPQRRA